MNNELRIGRENDPLLRQATEWALEMWDLNAPVERVAEWQIWLAADARHREAFARVEALMGIADKVRATALPGALELAADTYDAACTVSEWRSATEQGRRRRTRFKRPALYATAATVLLGVALVLSGHPKEFSVPGVVAYKRTETPAGGTRKMTLTDGSGVDIGGRSALRVVFTQDTRRVTLEKGEAFFRVAKDAARPFVVRAGDTTVTAVGTAFNVRRSGERIVVSVAEGAVRVDTPGQGQMNPTTHSLVAGQQLDMEPHTRAVNLATIESSAVAGWRDGRLRYLNEPLSSVIVDVARYTGREIELAEPSIGELRITGTVLERNLQGWLTSLEETFPVRATQRADGSIRLERTDRP